MSERGFTLIEALVALAVLAAVLAGVFGVFSSSLRNLSRGDERLTLALAAESLLNRTELDLGRGEARLSGTLPDGLSWVVTRRPYEPAELREGLTIIEARPEPRAPGDDVSLLPPSEEDGEDLEEGEESAEAEEDGPFQLGDRREEAQEAGGNAASVRLRAWLVRVDVADHRGQSFTLSRLSLERAR